MAKLALAVVLLMGVPGCVSTQAARPFTYDTDVVHRSEWGWEKAGIPAIEHSISKITIHHGGVEFAADRDPVEYLRALQKWSRTDKGWPDLPYHYVIDLDGNIYEGRPLRFAGDTNTSYDPAGHALIVVVGNYDTRTITDVQLESLAKISAYLADEHSVALADIKGHKDYAPGETSCPGTDIYRYLEDGSLLDRINQRRSTVSMIRFNQLSDREGSTSDS